MRVTHPHHPLYNQVVKVLRLAGNPAYPEPCYLIELPDGSRAELPCSWAVPASAAEPLTACSPRAPELWAGVGEYLALARLVQALAATLEATCDEQLPNDCTSDRDSGKHSACLGTISAGMPERAHPNPGDAAATPAPAPGARKGDGRSRSGRSRRGP
jgi:hypothetical protein